MSYNTVLAGIYGTYAEDQEKTAQSGPRTLHDLAKQIVSAGQGDDDLQKTASDITEVTAGLAQYDAAGRVAAHAFFIEMEKEAAAGDFSKLNAFFAEEEEPVVKTATLGERAAAELKRRGLDKLAQNVRVAPGYEDPTDTVLHNAGFDYGAQAPTKSKARMAAQGALGGGVVGAGLGLSVGEAFDMKHRGRLAAMGAGAGALLGGVTGHQAHGLRTTRAAEMAEKGIVLNDDGSLTLTPEAAAQFMGPAR